MHEYERGDNVPRDPGNILRTQDRWLMAGGTVIGGHPAHLLKLPIRLNTMDYTPLSSFWFTSRRLLKSAVCLVHFLSFSQSCWFFWLNTACCISLVQILARYFHIGQIFPYWPDISILARYFHNITVKNPFVLFFPVLFRNSLLVVSFARWVFYIFSELLGCFFLLLERWFWDLILDSLIPCAYYITNKYF